MPNRTTTTPTSALRDEIWTPPEHPGTGATKSRLLADYIERAEALTVQAELLRLAVESGRGLSAAWRLAEEALTNVRMARFALAQEIGNPARQQTPGGGKILKFRTAGGAGPVTC